MVKNTSDTTKQAWEFFCKDLAKVSSALDAYEKIMSKIEIRDHAYDPFFQLVLDGFSARILMSLSRMVDAQSRSWSLYDLTIEKAEVYKIRTDIEELKKIRDKQIAHLEKGFKKPNHFIVLTPKGIKIARRAVLRIHKMLSDLGRRKYGGDVYALEWGNLESSLQLLLEKLD